MGGSGIFSLDSVKEGGAQQMCALVKTLWGGDRGGGEKEGACTPGSTF